MAVKGEFDVVTDFEDWYEGYRVDTRDGALMWSGFNPCAVKKVAQMRNWKTEMDTRLANHWKYEKMADAAIVQERPDIPNVSSGDGAGMLQRIARSVVQQTPNITVTSQFDDDSIPGALATWIAKSKIIGDDEYSNDMQQHLFASFIRGLAIGFDCVVPALLQNSMGSWYMQYDNIHYRDVFPEPGAKDVRRATAVYVRRYLTRGEVHQLIQTQAVGWDIPALKRLLTTEPGRREHVDQQSKKHSINAEGYEIFTWYSSTGAPFLTWHEQTGMLLRIEKNKYPLKEHPVHFLVPNFDGQQPFGRSILSLIYGRLEFQDWYLNGAIKLWRLNMEPPIIGYGVVNAIPNIGPGKYTNIQNPNARVEPFEINTQSLLMFGQISGTNQANMQQTVGAADQQMAMQTTGGLMSQTPQGVDAAAKMVDITTNNYQKALETFFSRYCSYALTLYFQELKTSVTSLTPSAQARKQMINQGVPPEAFVHEAYDEPVTDPETNVAEVVHHKKDSTGLKDGQVEADFKEMAVMYFVKVVPGSLTELEDAKQARLINQSFIPLSQSLPAIAQSGDQQSMQNATKAMMYMVRRIIELTGSDDTTQIVKLLEGDTQEAQTMTQRMDAMDERLNGETSPFVGTMATMLQTIKDLQDTVIEMGKNQVLMANQLGVQMPTNAAEGVETAPPAPEPGL